MAPDHLITSLKTTLLNATYSQYSTANGLIYLKNQILGAIANIELVTTGPFIYDETSSF